MLIKVIGFVVILKEKIKRTLCAMTVKISIKILNSVSVRLIHYKDSAKIVMD